MNPATRRQSRSYSDGISMTMFIPLNQDKKYGNPHHFMVSSLMGSCFGSTTCFISYTSCFISDTSNIYNLLISNRSLQVPFFSTTYDYLLRHNSRHTHPTFVFHIWYSNAVRTFETNPYPQKCYLQVNSTTLLR